jgi:glycine/D-amino acid oxidase-like deaminating enzyme
MKSLWLDGDRAIPVDDFSPGSTYDTVVVGAGITGMATAALLARSGMTVAVLEARSVGAGTTGNTTAKLSLLQGTVLSGLRRQYPQKVVNAYVEANREGQAWLLRHLQDYGAPFQRRDAYTFAVSDEGADRIRSELAVSSAAGLAVEEVADPGLPFPTRGAIRLPDQAQFNPMDVLESLAADFRAHGGILVEGVRVRNVTNGKTLSIRTDSGDVHAGHVVLATGTPSWTAGCTSPS